jgi:hypothetical protein
VTTQAILQGYLGAVATSVTLAVGINQGLKRSPLAPALKATLSRFVAYPAVAMASTCNMLLMRRVELETGIEIKARGRRKQKEKS